MKCLATSTQCELNVTQAVTVTIEPRFLSVNCASERTDRLVNRIGDGVYTIFSDLRPELVPIGVRDLAASEEESQRNDNVVPTHRLSSNENKMSDGGRERASLGVKVWKSSQKWSAQRSAVRSIAWLGTVFISLSFFESTFGLFHHGTAIAVQPDTGFLESRFPHFHFSFLIRDPFVVSPLDVRNNP